MKKIFETLNKTNKFSLFILLIIFSIIFYLLLLNFGNFKNKNNGLLEISKDFKLDLRSYNFENNLSDRQIKDRMLYIVLNNTVSQEEFNSLEFKTIPEQEIEPEYYSSQVIRVNFKQPSLADEKTNYLLITKDEKQVLRIPFRNLKIGEGFEEAPPIKD